MPSITLTFSAPLNVSCQTGDTAYFVQTAGVTNTGFTINSNNVVEIGQIRQITNPTSNSPTIICDTTLSYASTNGQNRFILFSKDKYCNPSGLLGYYAKVCFRNNSTTKAELFGINADMFESSK